MKRTVTGLCCAAAFAFAATLGAQTPTTTTPSTSNADHEVTISGCLAKSAGGYQLTNARMDTAGSSTTTTAPGSTTTATAGTATGTSGAMAAAAGPAMTWTLTGDSDLEKHVGHKIQVTGKTTWDASMSHGRTSTTTSSGAGTTAAAPPSSTTSATNTAAGSADQPRMDVKSIKMVSTSCS